RWPDAGGERRPSAVLPVPQFYLITNQEVNRVWVLSRTHAPSKKESHLVRPVINRLLVSNFLSQAPDDLRRRPQRLLRAVLLGEHAIQDGHDPVFEPAVVVVGDEQVAYAVQSLAPELRSWQLKVAKVGGAKALYDVLLNSAGAGDDAVDERVLHQEAYRLTQARGDEVGSIAQEDLAPRLCPHGAVPSVLGLVGEEGLVRQAPVALTGFPRNTAGESTHGSFPLPPARPSPFFATGALPFSPPPPPPWQGWTPGSPCGRTS
ncbi:MAG: hypothetical protein BJ554DRAFT_719, partial [Olpidium bornovanus]